MIRLYEQHDGYIDLHDQGLDGACHIALEGVDKFTKSIKRLGEDALCFSCSRRDAGHYFEASYFVGVDWIVEGHLPIYVAPKQNAVGDVEIDYIKMLNEALQEEDNIDHISELVEVDFSKPYIEINQQQDLLSLFLIAEYIHIVRRIVKKGLKRSYYKVEDNLKSKIKGKVLMGMNISKNDVRANKANVYCQYQEYGVDISENRILKRALLFASRVLMNYKGGDPHQLLAAARGLCPAFDRVSDDVGRAEIISCKPSPVYKEYERAVRIAKLILKRYSYNIVEAERETISTPPFWIDMSKLFELYVFSKLRKLFTSQELMYHFKARKQELDYLLNPKMESLPQMVIDAKYKPRYHFGGVDTSDIRQISGYSRLKKVYDRLGIKDYNCNINCLIIFSNQNSPDDITLNDDCSSFRGAEIVSGYVGIHKLGIKLPEIELNRGDLNVR